MERTTLTEFINSFKNKKFNKAIKYNLRYTLINNVTVYKRISSPSLVKELLDNVNDALEVTNGDYYKECKDTLEGISNPDEILKDKYWELLFHNSTYPVIVHKGIAYQQLPIEHDLRYLDIRYTIPCSHSEYATSYDEAIKLCKKKGVRMTPKVVSIIKRVFHDSEMLICF